jgi:hypothetical protein
VADVLARLPVPTDAGPTDAAAPPDPTGPTVVAAPPDRPGPGPRLEDR